MIVPILEHIKREIVETGKYKTKLVTPGRFADRFFTKFDFWAHFLLLRVIARGCSEARKGTFDRWSWGEHSVRSIWAVERCGGYVEIIAPTLPEIKEPAVYVANHMSMLETLIMPGPILAFNDGIIVVKQALLDMPFFGHLMKTAGSIGVGREDPREDLKVMLEGCGEALKKGKSIMIFPQSTRLPVFDESKFNSIGVKIASRAGVPVVPVALKTDWLGVGRVLRDFGKIDRSKKIMFRFGEPIPPSVDRKETHARCVKFITDNLLEWGAEVVGHTGRTIAEKET